MSDAASSVQSPNSYPDAPQSALTPEKIERILADFRDWLTLQPAPLPEIPEPTESVDLHTVVGQFIALRHEVNLQTKATRATLDQNATLLQQNTELVEQLEATVEAAQSEDDTESQNDEVLKPVLKAIVDTYDALALSLRQVARQKESIRGQFEELKRGISIAPPPDLGQPVIVSPPPPGFFGRMFGKTPAPPVADAGVDARRALQEWRDQVLKDIETRNGKTAEAAQALMQSFEGLLTGYQMSLNRVERLFPLVDMQPMNCVGQPFDPEKMEVVETVKRADKPTGEVVEEMRRGYLRRGQIFRYAQVRIVG